MKKMPLCCVVPVLFALISGASAQEPTALPVSARVCAFVEPNGQFGEEFMAPGDQSIPVLEEAGYACGRRLEQLRREAAQRPDLANTNRAGRASTTSTPNDARTAPNRETEGMR